MLRSAILGIAVLGLGACASAPGEAITQIFAPKPQSAEEALGRYYATIPDSDLPAAPLGASFPSDDQVLTRILIGSCNDEEQDSPVLAQIAQEEADLFLMVGDNVYGDRDGRDYVNNDPDLMEVRASFADLAARPEFKSVRAAHPMMVAWDDHDYGANDAGIEFPFKGLAERIHEVFWGLEDEDVGQWPGTYYGRSFGPEGQRVQIIMLDTRSFRSSLTKTDEWGKAGKERYIPAPDGSPQDMLGAAQWTWLENQLQKPADLRFIVSSIQVLPTVHGWESWSRLPAERAHLLDLINDTGASGVIFLSGDRHTGFLYETDEGLPYMATELTASSMNLSFSDSSSEEDIRQVGAGYAKVNFGAVAIDWDTRMVTLSLHDEAGQSVRENSVAFDAIGVE